MILIGPAHELMPLLLLYDSFCLGIPTHMDCIGIPDLQPRVWLRVRIKKEKIQECGVLDESKISVLQSGRLTLS